MASQLCPKCASPVLAGQRFCSNCGSVVEPDLNQPTELKSGANLSSAIPDEETFISPPPPPPTGVYSQAALPPQAYISGTDNFRPTPTPAPGSFQPVPTYAQPQKDATGSVLSQIGCGVFVVILLGLAICGGAGYWGYTWLTGLNKNPSNSNNTLPGYQTPDTASSATATSNTTTNSTPAPSAAKTSLFPASQNFVYANVKVTILDVKQADAFADDSSSKEKGGVLRLDLKEENSSVSYSSYSYSNTLIQLPNGTSVKPFAAKEAGSIESNVIRTNWIDFSVPTSTDVNKVNLLVGTESEEQINLPLTGSADLTKYQPKTVTLTAKTQYDNMDWMITSAQTQLSYDGAEASKGQFFVTLTFKVDNNSSTEFIANASSYMRLKSGPTTSPPKGSTLTNSIAVGQTNVTGTVVFPMLQGSTDFTLILLPDTYNKSPQSSIDFQIK